MWWDKTSEGFLLKVKAQPGAQRDEISCLRGDELVVRVNAQPEEGKANKALIAFLSKQIKIAKSEIVLRQGTSARHKCFLLPENPKVAQWLESLATIYPKESA